jgi:hypothetical protein
MMNEEFENPILYPTGSVQIISNMEVYENCEWCFQFDDDPPFVFATMENTSTFPDPTVTFKLKNTSDSTLEFTFDGKRFKLFAREKKDESKD